MKQLRYSTQTISRDDIKSVTNVLNSEWLTQGPETNLFEKKIKNTVNSKYAVAVNSGSSALLLACKALSLKKGDIFWTTPNTFVATANCGLLCGAKVDFVDIDPQTWNISLEKLEQKLIKAKKKKKLPKVLIVVHLAGLPVNPKVLFKLSEKYQFKIIEDASHSLGATYFSKKVGSSRWSDVTVFSLHPVKIITTGEGGLCVTNNKKVFEKMLLFKNNGITNENKKFIFKSLGPWYYEQHDLGYNFRISEIQAALGISQLKKLKKFVKKRNLIAKIYNKNFNALPIETQTIDKKFISTYHLFIIKLKKHKTHLHLKLFNYLRNNKIFVNLHYLPVHLHPYFKKQGFKNKSFPIAENYSKSAMSIPIYPNLKKKEQSKVIFLIKRFFKSYD
jgi:UDP-4-amino-4,6-dideoxy-N-acetyl-beta-L-altrosamine transaminase